MSNKNVFYCREGHEGLAFVDKRAKRNCPECKEPMMITGFFEDNEEEASPAESD